MKDKILFVGGDWDLKGGKSSSIVNKFAAELTEEQFIMAEIIII